MNKDEISTNHQIKHLPAKLVGAVILMFGFGFALVPLYDVFCDITGINGKGFERAQSSLQRPLQSPSQDSASNSLSSTKNAAAVETNQSIEVVGRSIQVQFIAQPQSGFSGDFYPQSVTLEATINKPITTAYIARNATDHALHLQAIPSISPAEAATYITKMECFCFQQQTLNAGQQREMGLTFSVSDELPDHIQKVTFSYSLYPLEITKEPRSKTLTLNQNTPQNQKLNKHQNQHLKAHQTTTQPDANDMIMGGNHEPHT